MDVNFKEMEQHSTPALFVKLKKFFEGEAEPINDHLKEILKEFHDIGDPHRYDILTDKEKKSMKTFLGRIDKQVKEL
jgi:predicted nucleic acid-binding OB-fold protein